ncbi:MAG: hypothetical protein KUG69_10585 [Marinosulfonomonas sp.]|nr:hypothetical protein [Marinosulfonomonas sp.]
MRSLPRIAYFFDPGFPGGTSSAVAAELTAIAKIARIEVHAVSTRMFRDKPVSTPIQKILVKLGLDLIWDAPTITADVVLIHNPSFLKFHTELKQKIIANHLIVITHENFLGPGGNEGFDVDHCLDLVDRCSLALQKTIAPISPYNRLTVKNWLSTNDSSDHWEVLEQDWFNICDFEILPPVASPQDRRGRHSRPGPEKFPLLADMDRCFSKSAQSNIILGADLFLAEKLDRNHWNMVPFGGLEVARYFEMIDFMVYFTAPTWRESFGRVMAEAIAAGKVVISDPETASVFGGAVLGARPADVDDIIANFVRDPRHYQEHVLYAQMSLAAYSTSTFQQIFPSLIRLNHRHAA